MNARLLENLKSPDTHVRAAAAEALCHLGSEARDAAVSLVQATGDSDESVMQWATAALESLGPPPATAVAELAAIVAGEQRGPAFWAATLLGRLGLAANDAKPALQQAVASSSPEASRRAAWALEKISAR